MSALSNRKAIICGATGGMGRAVALAFSREGIATALMARDQARLEALAEECAREGKPAIPVTCDLARPESISTSVDDAIQRLGGLNILFNCAGIHKSGKAHELDLDDWNATLDTNLRAHYTLARHTLLEINKTPGGAIIKIGSIAVPHSSGAMHLAVSKALDGYADCLFEDVREYGTKVCTIRPGYVNTPMVKSDRLDRKRMISPDDVAETVLFILRMPETTCPTEIVLRPQRSPYKK